MKTGKNLPDGLKPRARFGAYAAFGLLLALSTACSSDSDSNTARSDAGPTEPSEPTEPGESKDGGKAGTEEPLPDAAIPASDGGTQMGSDGGTQTGSDGGVLVSDGGALVSDGGALVSDGGALISDGGRVDGGSIDAGVRLPPEVDCASRVAVAVGSSYGPYSVQTVLAAEMVVPGAYSFRVHDGDDGVVYLFRDDALVGNYAYDPEVPFKGNESQTLSFPGSFDISVKRSFAKDLSQLDESIFDGCHDITIEAAEGILVGGVYADYEIVSLELDDAAPSGRYTFSRKQVTRGACSYCVMGNRLVRLWPIRGPPRLATERMRRSYSPGWSPLTSPGRCRAPSTCLEWPRGYSTVSTV